MAELVVWEAAREGLARRLGSLCGPAAVWSAEPDVLVISPAAAAAGGRGRARCGTVLLPGTAAALLDRIEARGAVSYGTSGRDSVALSGRDGERLAVSLQRELVRLDGAVVERQELVTRASPSLDGALALALVGTLLLLGTEPGELARLYLA